jgi:hypothetical protein
VYQYIFIPLWICGKCIVSDRYVSFIQKNHFVTFYSFFKGFGLVKLDVKTKSCSGVVSVGYPISL